MASKSYKVPFSIDDVVCSIHKTAVKTFIKCPLCDGVGKIKIKDETRTCPDCYGRKGDMEYGLDKWQIVKNAFERQGIWHDTTVKMLTIGQVRIEHTKGSKARFTAMCKETGVGSGSVHDMEDFFSTLKEAEEACLERNK
jgi:hypothetical protein